MTSLCKKGSWQSPRYIPFPSRSSSPFVKLLYSYLGISFLSSNPVMIQMRDFAGAGFTCNFSILIGSHILNRNFLLHPLFAAYPRGVRP